MGLCVRFFKLNPRFKHFWTYDTHVQFFFIAADVTVAMLVERRMETIIMQ